MNANRLIETQPSRARKCPSIPLASSPRDDVPAATESDGRMTGRPRWYIKRCRLFERLYDQQLGRLETRACVRTFPKNSPIYLPSDASRSVLLLAEGRVKLSSVTPDGKQSIMALIVPGELFGELALLGNGTRDEHAETVLASTVVLLPVEAVEQLMSESPELSLGVTKLIGFRRKRIERRLQHLLFRSNRERLVHLLMELVENYGQRQSDGVGLNLKLSHQDLAGIIGSTRESVTVLLGELQLEGCLKISRQRIVIQDFQRLTAGTDAVIPPLPGLATGKLARTTV